MILIAAVIYGILIFETVRLQARYDALSEATEIHIRCEQLTSMVIGGSDTLTNEARIYVVTGEIEHAEAYFVESEETRSRDKGLEEMRLYHSGDDVLEYLETAMYYSNDLMNREYYAMRLASDGFEYDESQIPQQLWDVEISDEDAALSDSEKISQAQYMMFGDEYMEEKSLIQENVDKCYKSVLEYTEAGLVSSDSDLKTSLTTQRLALTLMFVLTVLIFIFMIVLVIRPLQTDIRCIRENRTLEVKGSYEFKYLAATYNEIYELNSTNESLLRERAEHDGLTGILNRAAFDRLCTTLRGYPMHIAFLIIDVDEFKKVNDTYGHIMGDRVLKAVANEITLSFRTTDIIARIGGDEFCVVMTDMKPNERNTIAEKIDRINNTLQNPTDDMPKTSLSVGIAFSSDGYNEDLYKKADSALYTTKENGRGGYTFAN